MRLGPYTSFLLVHFIAPTSLQHMPPVSLALYVPFQAAVCHCLSVRSPHSPCSFLSWNVTGAPQLRECLINLSASKSDPEPGWGDESGDSGWIWHSSLCRHAQAPPCSTHCPGSRIPWLLQEVGRPEHHPLWLPKASLHRSEFQNRVLILWYLILGFLQGHVALEVSYGGASGQ